MRASRDSERRVRRSTTETFRAGAIHFRNILTQDPAMSACLDLAAKAATVDAPVMVNGETGTGKTLIAQAIHNASARASEPCILINCAAMTETLMEAELFGHEKGAFTGADRLHRGAFETAHKGTLILDEIGEMAANAQAKILHAVEYRQFQRLGGEAPLHSDIRIIAVTNRPLAGLLRDGRFRQDLFFRLKAIEIQVPPLRKRAEDVPLLAERFLANHAEAIDRPGIAFAPAAMQRLRAYRWPGNVRELDAVIKTAYLAAEGTRIEADHLALMMTEEGVKVETAHLEGDLSLATAERNHIELVLALAGGNKSHAAELLEISRTTLHNKLAAYAAADRTSSPPPPPPSPPPPLS